MTGTHTQNPIFSRITLALMEDTGFVIDSTQFNYLIAIIQLVQGQLFLGATIRVWKKFGL